jgi:hypothetical protein
MGREPIYSSQITHPEQFMQQYWAGGQFKPVATDKSLEAPAPDLLPPKLAGLQAPRIVLVKRAGRRDAPFTVAVDFDGTIAEQEKPFDPESAGPPRPGIKGWLDAFRDAGARIIIFTVRGDDGFVRDYLDEHELPYDYVNENPDQPEGSSGKVYADVYWDDRGFNAEDLDEHGPEILDRIREHEGAAEEEEEGGGPSGGPVAVIERVRILLAPEDILEEILSP